MKKKITALLMGALLVMALSGCTNGGSSSSEKSDSSQSESSAEEVSLDEDGNPVIDLDDSEGWEIVSDDESDEGDGGEEGDEGDEDGEDEDPFSQQQYTIHYISGKNITSSDTMPATYLIKSVEELNSFIEANKTLYSLDEEYSADDDIDSTTFIQVTKKFNEDYFSTGDIVLVFSDYSLAGDCDLGDTTVKDSTIHFDIWAAKPASAEDTGYVCFIVNIEKGSADGKTITASIAEDALISGENIEI